MVKSEYGKYLSSIEEVIEDARNGRMFILVDDEDRENEGDLIIPAQMATPDAINFMARHGRGLICMPITAERGAELKLDMMARSNEMRHGTAFTVSIEAKEGISTGISAHDRARTVAIAADPSRGASDIVSPGHVFPLIARDGGVLMRAGHTEAAVDIARLAGLQPSGVICEIMKDDGTMARLPDLVEFAKEHKLKLATIADLIAYRRQNDRIFERRLEREVHSVHGGKFDLKIYVNTLQYAEHIALVKGDVTTDEPVLVRVHVVNVLDDILGLDAQKSTLLPRSMQLIAGEGRGVVVLIREAQPEAVSKALGGGQKDDSHETRLLEIGAGSHILRDLGVRDIILLSNTEQPKIVGLEGFGLRIVGQRPISGDGA